MANRRNIMRLFNHPKGGEKGHRKKVSTGDYFWTVVL